MRKRTHDANINLYFLKFVKAPAMLIKGCFVENKGDVQLYWYQDMATAIVYGITCKRVEEEEEPSYENITSGEEIPTGNAKQIYRVQVGAYSLKDNAENMQKKLKTDGYDAVIVAL